MEPTARPTSRRRILTPGRAAALLVAGVLLLWLAYLYLDGDDRASVPEGAKAGELTLEPCSYDTEAGSRAADCGTLVVPENRTDPGSRLIALPVTRIRAQSETPREPIFRLEGGPGQSNMKFPAANRFTTERDVVLVGYRGVDGSSVLDCPEVESALKRSGDLLSQESMRAYSGAFRDCASRLSDDGIDLDGYTLTERVEDFEAARVALGYERIDLLSESAGTRTAQVYAQRHPGSIRRSAMIAANPPGGFLWEPEYTRAQLQRYSELCSQDDDCRDRTDDLLASLRGTARDMPGNWLFLPVEESKVRLTTFYGLMESMTDGPLNAPMTFDAWLAAGDGDAAGFWAMSLLGGVTFPEAFVWGDLASVARIDADRAREHFARADRDVLADDPATRLLWADGRLADAWPAGPEDDAYDQVRDSDVETLVIGGNLDGAAPTERAAELLLPHLPNGRQVVLEELGHTTDFWNHQPEAGSRLINEFFATGAVDDSLYEHRAMDFDTDMSFGAVGRIALGALLGLALIAVLSLLWMPRRVRWAGSFGRKAGVALRALFPAVLGLGGWSAATLVVLSTSVNVPLDGELLAVGSAGVPIALGIYWAWVHRDMPRSAKAGGFAAATAGALLGGWLGFNATEDLLALLTTIVGAAAGANLALLAYAMRLDARGARDDGVPTVDAAAPEGRVPVGV